MPAAHRVVGPGGASGTLRALIPDLVYDVGMHLGEDTAYYLSRGFRVVGVEANPALAADLRARFAAEIAEGRLTIVDKAIAAEAGVVRFAVSSSATEWGSTDEAFVRRTTALGDTVDWIEVPAVPFEDVVAEHGVPYFLKVDIEGSDLVCIEGLARVAERPPFLSMESLVTAPEPSVAKYRHELDLLASFGYRSFAYVEQGGLERLNGRRLTREGEPTTYEHPTHGSGPFGREAPARWRSRRGAEAVAAGLFARHVVAGRWTPQPRPLQLVGKAVRRAVPSQRRIRWYDLHASLDPMGAVPRDDRG